MYRKVLEGTLKLENEEDIKVSTVCMTYLFILGGRNMFVDV